MPARPNKPKDKAKAEPAMLPAQRWILAVLWNETFFSILDLNARIRELLEVLNDRPMQKLGVSQRELFETGNGAWRLLDERSTAQPGIERRSTGIVPATRRNFRWHLVVDRHTVHIADWTVCDVDRDDRSGSPSSA